MPARSRAPSCSKTACSRRWRWCARCARCGSTGSATSTRSTTRRPTSSRSCRTTACAPRGRRSSARRCKRLFAGAAFAPIVERCIAIHQDVLRGPGLGGAAHARRRRQRAHQHPGQQRQLRDAADRARGGGAHHEARAQPRRRDLRRARHRHHEARVPDRRRDRCLQRVQAARRPAGALQQGQAAARARACTPT